MQTVMFNVNVVAAVAIGMWCGCGAVACAENSPMLGEGGI